MVCQIRAKYILKFAGIVFEELKYLVSNPWELWGAITAIACVWLAARENILNWPVSLVSVILYTKVFYDSRLYSDALLQIVFAGFQVYGWYQWQFSKKEVSHVPKPLVQVHYLSPAHRFRVFLLVCLLWPMWYQAVVRIKPDASLPLWDSLTMIISIIAIYWQAKKVIESWWLWILVDLIYVPMYAQKNLYLTAIIYMVFLVLAGYGLGLWRRSFATEKQPF